jgi:hypothetical protein
MRRERYSVRHRSHEDGPTPDKKDEPWLTLVGAIRSNAFGAIGLTRVGAITLSPVGAGPGS